MQEQELLTKIQQDFMVLKNQSPDQPLQMIRNINYLILKDYIDNNITKSTAKEFIQWAFAHHPESWDVVLTHFNHPIPEELYDNIIESLPAGCNDINKYITTKCHTDIGLLTQVSIPIFKHHIFFNFNTLCMGICMHKNITLLKLFMQLNHTKGNNIFKMGLFITEHDFSEGYKELRTFLNSDVYEYKYHILSPGGILTCIEDHIYKYDAVNILKYIINNHLVPEGIYTFEKACALKAPKCALYFCERKEDNDGAFVKIIYDISDDRMIDVLKHVLSDNQFIVDFALKHSFEKGQIECIKYLCIESNHPVQNELIETLIRKKYFDCFMLLWNNNYLTLTSNGMAPLLKIGIFKNDVEILEFLWQFNEANELHDWALKQCFDEDANDCANWLINKYNVSNYEIMHELNKKY